MSPHPAEQHGLYLGSHYDWGEQNQELQAGAASGLPPALLHARLAKRLHTPDIAAGTWGHYQGPHLPPCSFPPAPTPLFTCAAIAYAFGPCTGICRSLR